MKYTHMATVATPPTSNNLYANRRHGHGRVMTPEYRAWRKAASTTMREAFPYFAGPFEAEIFCSINRQRDLDNIVKPMLDALGDSKRIKGDRWADQIRLRRLTPEQLPIDITIIFVDHFLPKDTAFINKLFLGPDIGLGLE